MAHKPARLPSPLTAQVASLPATVPFVGPETQERARGACFKARLGANENVFGASPKAVEAMRQAASEAWMYGDPTSFELRCALAKKHDVGIENIVVGEGIDGLLGYLARMLVEPGTTIVTSEGAYPTFNFHVAGFGGALAKVPYVDDREDPASLIAKARETNAKMIYFANPDNPMGSWQEAKIVQALIDDVPDNCLLCLDEAYVEFAPEGTAPAIDVSNQAVIRMRTFSKAYGMAGARIGYAIGHEDMISAFDRIRNHFGVNRIAQAGALAAIGDDDWMAQMKRDIASARQRIDQIARENGLTTLPSATNFVAIDCGEDGTFAKAVLDALVAQDVFVRMPFVAPQNRCIRVSAGRPDDLDELARALPVALDRARAQEI